jgi:hypothetical protein
MDTLKEVFDEIKPLLATYQPPLLAIADYESRYELYTGKAVVIDGRPKPTLAFAALIIQNGYVGFYFMPIYTNVEILSLINPELLKLRKGKSCFHIKKTSTELLNHIKEALRLGFEKYRLYGWV